MTSSMLLLCGIAKKTGVATVPMSNLDCRHVRHVYVCIPGVIAAPHSSNLHATQDG